MGNNYSIGFSAPVAGARRSLSDLTVPALMSLLPRPARPIWKVPGYPVSVEEVARLKQEATEPAYDVDAIEDITTADEDAVATTLETPEDLVIPGPATMAPSVVALFEGLTQTSWVPADCTIAVGPADVLVGVNSDVGCYSKSGSLKFRWIETAHLFSPVLPSGVGIFDPRLAYDHYEGRWIIIAVARRESPAASWLLVAVSQGSDPSGDYWVWALDGALDGTTPTNNWMDYPMLGFDTQAIYVSSNMFNFAGEFQHVKLRILNKSELYAGGSSPDNSIRWTDLWGMTNPDGSEAFTIQPATHFRGVTGNPPAYLVSALWPGGNSLTLWTLSNPLALWSGASASLARVAVPCQTYSLPPQASQPDTNIRINTGDTRLLNAIYHYSSGVQRLWTSHTTRHTWPGEPQARSAAQWYEIDIPTQAVVQQNRYGSPGKYCYYPAIQTDASGNAFMVFGRSGPDEYAEIRQTGRKAGDRSGELTNSALIKIGEGSYKSGRWGDYFGICRDGGDNSLIWMYGQYADTGDTWGTWICAAKAT